MSAGTVLDEALRGPPLHSCRGYGWLWQHPWGKLAGPLTSTNQECFKLKQQDAFFKNIEIMCVPFPPSSPSISSQEKTLCEVESKGTVALEAEPQLAFW